MTDISTINLISQMRAMTAQAQGVAVGANQESFSTAFKEALSEVNSANRAADEAKAGYQMGDPNFSLADVMIAGQKSNLGFEAALRVRNKLLQAYQDIMSMPV